MADTLKVYCNRCMGETKHGIARRYVDESDQVEVVNWYTIKCNGCDSISFYKEHIVVSELDGGLEVAAQFLYPPRLIRRPRYFEDAPSNLDELYKETISAFNGNSLLFCAGGLRALVEGICAHERIADGPKRDWDTDGWKKNKTGNVMRGKTLDCLIEGLAEKGILTEAHAKVLHEHRYLGNEALHALKVPDADDLMKAINIMENVMEALYSIQAQAGELTKKRERARALKSRK